MLLNHWIVKDYFTRNITMCFVEPDLKCIDTLLHVTDKETLRYLMTAEITDGWKFETEAYRLVYCRNGGMHIFIPAHKSYGEAVWVDFFQKVIGEYLEAVQKMEDHFADRSS